jgi:hypothetical protein
MMVNNSVRKKYITFLTEELQNFTRHYCVVNGRRMRWTEYVAHTKFWLESLQGRCHSEDLVVYGKIILKWILKK